ncbi:uncharacterized protein N7479_002755 [Penicillium vulpinum]|uniref:uncharacterized protein n=1 Tax=Penicillium vulpinum TaxID=29845 RepID=UPI0025480481|nr:uncharacterized protein N7479_002755 [Penicillium vulpinum]KAJ5972837.1 hypothetical protein N7479_002755 [Penicillium vulpinum]
MIAYLVINIGARNNPDRQWTVNWTGITRSDDEYQWDQYPTRSMTQQASDMMWTEGGYRSRTGDEDIPAQSPDVLSTDVRHRPACMAERTYSWATRI